MYLSAERLALANQEVKETFEQTSVAWQALPQWDTGDPGQARVRSDAVNAPGFIDVKSERVDFQLTVLQANAPTPDSMLAVVIASTAKLAQAVDQYVVSELYKADKNATETNVNAPDLQDALIKARAEVEDAGYRAPACLITNTEGLTKLSQLVNGGYNVLEQMLAAANINSLHRSNFVDTVTDKSRLILVGRRQRIVHGNAAEASPGEEPVDLAISLCPSLEIVGETAAGKIEASVRIRYALRVKDPSGLVAIKDK